MARQERIQKGSGFKSRPNFGDNPGDLTNIPKPKTNAGLNASTDRTLGDIDSALAAHDQALGAARGARDAHAQSPISDQDRAKAAGIEAQKNQDSKAGSANGAAAANPPQPAIQPPANRGRFGRSEYNADRKPSTGTLPTTAGKPQSGPAGEKSASSQGTSGPPKMGAGAFIGFLNKNRKKFGLSGIILALIGSAIALILGLAPFKLIHIAELLNQYFGARQDHTSTLRMGKIWKAVADKDGNLHYARNTGHPLRDHIHNINSKRLVADMRKRGLNLSLDPKTGHITLDGKPMEGSLSDRRSQVRSMLRDAYPEDGYFRRALRAKSAFHAFGISFRFFEDPREKINDWENEMKHKIRERLFGSPPEGDPVAGTDSKKKADGETAKAIQDLNDQWGGEASATRDHALTTNDPIAQPKIDLSTSQLAADGAKDAADAAKGAFNMTAWLTRICDAKNIMTEIRIAAFFLRHIALARAAGTYLVAAHQFMSGDGIPWGELFALVKTTNGFEQSDGWQVITGADPNRQFHTAPQFSLDLTKQGGGAAFFIHVSNALDDAVGGGVGGAVCKVATNIFFQIFSTVVTIGLDFFTAGGPSIIGTAVSAASSFAIGALVDIVKPMAVNMLAGMTVTGDEPGHVLFDAVFGGGDVIFNDFFRRNGGHALTKEQIGALNQEIATEQAQDTARLSLADRVFNLNNPNSALAKFAFSMPTSFSGLTDSFMRLFSYVNPMVLEHAMLSPNGVLMRMASPAHADYPRLDDPLGVTQFGLSDDEINDPNVDDPEANEAYILDHPDIKKQWEDFRDKCFNTDQVDQNDLAMCDSNSGITYINGQPTDTKVLDASTSELYNRFRIYRMDLGLVGGLDFTTGNISDLPDDDGN